MTDEKTFTWDEIERALRGGEAGHWPVKTTGWLCRAEVTEELRRRLTTRMVPKPRFGIYNDLPYRTLMHGRVLQEIDELGLDHEAIMLESSHPGFDPRWTPEELAKYHDRTPQRQKILTVWPEPTQVWFDAFRLHIPKYPQSCPIYAVDFDSEMRMKERFVDGFDDLDHFGRELATFADGLKSEGLIEEWQTDTFPGHREAHGTDALNGEDIQYIQSYSVAKEGRSWLGRYGRSRAADDYRFLRNKGNDETLGVVLAAWHQAGWPGSPEHAMAETARFAAQVTSEEGYERFRWWSLKHVVGKKKNHYALWGIRDSIKAIKLVRDWD